MHAPWLSRRRTGRWPGLMALLLALGLGGLWPAKPAAAKEKFSYQDIGSLGYPNWGVARMNKKGRMVGSACIWDCNVLKAFVTGKDGTGLRFLDNVPGDYTDGFDINQSGQVVGAGWTLSPYMFYGWVTGPQAKGVTVYPPAAGDDYLEFTAINDSGLIVGAAFTLSDNEVWAVAAQAGVPGYRRLDWGPGGLPVSVNASGVVAGIIEFSEPNGWLRERCVVTGPQAEGLTELEDFGTGRCFVGQVSDAGNIVGHTRMDATGNSYHAWVVPSGSTRLQDLGIASSWSEATGTNAKGQIVGYYKVDATGETRAFITQLPGLKVKDLDTLVALPAGLRLTGAAAINRSGQVVARGSDGHIYLLTPLTDTP